MCWIANRVKKPTEAKKPTADRSQKPTEAGKQKKQLPFLPSASWSIPLPWRRRRRPFTLRLILQNLCPGGDPRHKRLAFCCIQHKKKPSKAGPGKVSTPSALHKSIGPAKHTFLVASMQLHAAHWSAQGAKKSPDWCCLLRRPVVLVQQLLLLALLRAARFWEDTHKKGHIQNAKKIPVIDCILSQLC